MDWGDLKIKARPGTEVLRDDKQWRAAIHSEQSTVERVACSIMTVPKNWELGPRMIDQHIVYWMVSESVILEYIDEATGVVRTRQLRPGDFMWLAPNVINRIRLFDPNRPFRMYNFRFRLLLGGKGFGFSESLRFQRNTWLWPRLLDLLFADVQGNHPDRTERLKRYLFLMDSEATSAQHGANVGSLSAKARNRIFELLDSDRRRRWTSSELSKAIGMSTRRLRQAIKATYGLAPRVWLMHQRIHAAAAVLEEEPNRALQEIAYEFGYDEPFLFSRQFKKVIGMSASDYRNRKSTR